MQKKASKNFPPSLSPTHSRVSFLSSFHFPAQVNYSVRTFLTCRGRNSNSSSKAYSLTGKFLDIQRFWCKPRLAGRSRPCGRRPAVWVAQWSKWKSGFERAGSSTGKAQGRRLGSEPDCKGRSQKVLIKKNDRKIDWINANMTGLFAPNCY